MTEAFSPNEALKEVTNEDAELAIRHAEQFLARLGELVTGSDADQ